MNIPLRPLLSCMLLAGCTTPLANNGDGGAPADGGAQGDGGATSDGAAGSDSGAVGGGALSCPAILECVSKCAANDSACVNQCLAQGSPEGQTAVNNLATCYQNNACADSACLQTKCPQEMQACVQSAGGGQPLEGGAPAGNVPADLVGEWIGTSTLYNFNADGTVSRSISVTSLGCKSDSLENGTVVVAGSMVTMYFTSGIFKLCGTMSTDPYKPTTDTFTYRIDTTNVGLALRLTQLNCMYTDQASIDFYCTNGFDNQ